jgi:hypothetical protein
MKTRRKENEKTNICCKGYCDNTSGENDVACVTESNSG